MPSSDRVDPFIPSRPRSHAAGRPALQPAEGRLASIRTAGALHRLAEQLPPTGAQVAAMWEQAKAQVLNGDYAAARLTIEHSLPSEAKLIEKMIQKREASLNANGVHVKE